jgi:cytoplasmic iron level regulating protein YaaA (DUF328/UPF0246 family)
VRIALISCVAKKKNCRAMAKDMYISPLFKSAYRYAQRNADKIFILSANAKNGLYGLLEETDLIEPYNETLNTKPVDEIKEWARNIIAALARKADLQNDEFILLAGEKYRKYLIGSLRNHSIPIKKMPIGKQLAFYKKANL